MKMSSKLQKTKQVINYLIGHCYKDTTQVPISNPVKLFRDAVIVIGDELPHNPP